MADCSHMTRWRQLNQWLLAHRALWQPAPFTDPEPGWSITWPELAGRVEAFSNDECQHYENDPVALAHILGHWLPSLLEVEPLTLMPEYNGSGAADLFTLPEVRARDMPGRKRLQAGAFAAAIQPLGLPVVDWCCGKGHLSRTLVTGCEHPVTGYEWNPALVADGNRLASKAGAPVTVYCQDVMAPDLTLPAGAHGVALHACGDLHRRLICQAPLQNLPRVSIAPCCFHLTAQTDYQPLSSAARHQPDCLELTRADLKLAVEETVTAPARVRKQVNTISQWRLGFDGLQRELRQQNQYLPVPSHPGWIANGDFIQFCGWAAARKRLSLPPDIDYPAWEAYGGQRLGRVRRHELVRHLFRRPLELWLVLDYVLFLEEQGYCVSLGTFCDRHLTPRNLLIDATRAQA